MSKNSSRKQQVAKRRREQGEPSTRLVSVQTEAWSGPLPLPSHLAEYNAVVPDGAERIFKVFEAQSAHRMDLERKVINSDIIRAHWGLILGFVLGLIALLGGIYLLALGRSVDGFAVVVLDAAVLVGSLYFSRRQRARQLAENE